MATRTMTIWDHNKLYVDAEVRENGDLAILGQDLNGAEYEYALVVDRSNVHLVLQALGEPREADVLACLQAHAETIITAGEQAWLKHHGIPAEFWSRFDMD